MSRPDLEVHDVRPIGLGSWTFLMREGGEEGDVVVTVQIRGLNDEGTIRVGEVPFEVTNERLSRTYRLVFEGVTLARAQLAGLFSSTYHLSVEPGLLQEEASGEAATFTVEATDLWRSVRVADAWGVVGTVERTGLLVRHFSCRFTAEVPLVLRAFCLALLLARLRRQQRNG